MEHNNLNQTMGSFLRDLGSDLPAPGGGAVSGVSGALGAALGSMVASLTLGRKKYEAFAQSAEQDQVLLSSMIERFMDLSDRDAAAYGGYMKAAAMPKMTEDEIAIRRESMQKAIRNSAAVPFDALKLCRETLSVIGSLYGRSNTTCVGDLAAGAMELAAAARIAWLNILANLPYFSDREAAEELYRESKEILTDVTRTAEELYGRIESDLARKF